MTRPRATRRSRDEGSITLEFAVIVPLLMLLVWIAIQFVMVFFANRVALSAAQEGVRTARARAGSISAAEQRSRRYLDELGGTLLLHPQVRALRTPDRAQIQVSGQAQQLIPFFVRLRVVQVAQSPLEQFRSPGSGTP
jgi:Flp pilus assembly protein TadG